MLNLKKSLGTALITPFTEEGGIDYIALGRLLRMQRDAEVDYIVVLGTTGEKATLDEKEIESIQDNIIAYYNTQKPLVLGFGGYNTADICKKLHELAYSPLEHCIDAILSVCPYYVKPTQEGLYQHFMEIHHNSPWPTILYNVPGRTGVNMLPETAMRLWQDGDGGIIGIKEASGNMEQIKKLIRLRDEYMASHPEAPYFSILCGDDGLAAEAMAAGADGLISVASNAFPKDFMRLIHNQDVTVQDKYADLIKLLFAEGNPVGIKAVLAELGITSDQVRLPLVSASPDLHQQIKAELQHIGYRLG